MRVSDQKPIRVGSRKEVKPDANQALWGRGWLCDLAKARLDPRDLTWTAHALLACECDARGREGRQSKSCAPSARLPGLLQAALAVDWGAVAAGVAARGQGGPATAAAIHETRVAAVRAALPAASL